MMSLIASGCSQMSALPSPGDSNSSYSASGAQLNDDEATRARLYQQYQQWRGTPYAWGGLSRQGIDCSGLVYLTYRDEFGLPVPRTTLQQSQIGSAVSRNELRPGDLVFFKTENKNRHVGMYLDNDQFLHVSTKSGVIISSFENSYWENHYWQSRRLAD
jgi:cell wall-associated NlpC family hydrolase